MRLPHPVGHLLLGQPQVLAQLPIGCGLLDGIQLLPLDVLHQGELEQAVIGDLLDHHGDHGESSLPGGPPAPLARDDLELVAHLAHHDGLDHAVLLQAFGQFSQRRLVEVGAGLGPVRHHAAQRQFPLVGILWSHLAHERGESPAQGRTLQQGHQASLLARISSPSHSFARLR